MNKDFALFQKEFKKWQREFGLNGWKVYFRYRIIKPKERFAELDRDCNNYVATASLNSEVPDYNKPFVDIKRDAKHEAIHLLLSRLVGLAEYRYASNQEISESEEELVNKLMGLIE